MEIKDFIEKFAELVDVENIEELTPDTKFRELDEWSSLAGLTIVSMYDSEFDKEVEPEDIKKAQTIQDLYNLL